MLEIFLKGLSLSGGLIIAIGSQNVFLLAQGLRQQHHILVAAICACFDALFIFAGVMGLGSLIAGNPQLLFIARWGGVVYLFVFGLLALKRAFSHEQLKAETTGHGSRNGVIAATLAVTLLNPHVYLDTVVMLGSIGAQFGEQRLIFVLGAVTASFVWFFSLGLGAARLAPYLSSPKVWKVLDIIICLVMWLIAWSLTTQGL
ncbi:MAG: LysE/ArgO family amino acid transporter [Endozoicomonas sp.]